MTIRQSYTIAHGGRYELGQHIGRIGRVRVVSIQVNGKLIRYAQNLTWKESGTPSRQYIEVSKIDDPMCQAMLMVNKDDRVIETFLSSDRFYDSVCITLDIDEVTGES